MAWVNKFASGTNRQGPPLFAIWKFWRKPGYAIERAAADDLPALADIHEAGFPQAWDADAIAGLIDSPGMKGWVARAEGEGGSVMGFVLVRGVADEAEIITIATDPQARGRGVGRALMEHVIRDLQRERAVRLFLEVSEGNGPALGLYRSLGFRQVGLRKSYYVSKPPSQPAPSALVMERHLR